ncbi:Na+/H+-dicarboxylate symporters [Legionella oakridgensis ATCC 33761 = DSM 21215]|uniref:Na+/H+-dicarboxylate symporters n=2 Tax=Legionella oakridgensis TaxID=29423 RepID=W0BFP2_9GAMM|nr:Na+/H+-dicarboxylate symporters [Legionella oakridgensis ATCC 33761 = DSM 21215]
MNVPITLMGIILPFYSLIDMLETSLNVWSDSCVAKIVDAKHTSVEVNETQKEELTQAVY